MGIKFEIGSTVKCKMAFLPPLSSHRIFVAACYIVPEDIGNVIISLDHCLCEELDLKIADNVYIFFILCSLEKRLLYFWKFGI